MPSDSLLRLSLHATFGVAVAMSKVSDVALQLRW